MIRNKSGKIIGSYEVGPFEIGQDLVLECEVKGGTISSSFHITIFLFILEFLIIYRTFISHNDNIPIFFNAKVIHYQRLLGGNLVLSSTRQMK